MTMTVAPLTTAALVAVGEHRAGAASGVDNATARVGGMVAVLLLGLVLTAGGRRVSIHAFHATALVAGAMAVVAGLARWFSAPRKGL